MIAFFALSFLLSLGLPRTAWTQSESSLAAIVPGTYHCHLFAGRALTTGPGFTIGDDGTYRHDNGSRGKYTFDPPQRRIVFEGGDLDKQEGRAAATEKLGIIRIYPDHLGQTYMICDTLR